MPFGISHRPINRPTSLFLGSYHTEQRKTELTKVTGKGERKKIILKEIRFQRFCCS